MQSGSTDNLALKNADGDFWDWGEIKTIVRSGSECIIFNILRREIDDDDDFHRHDNFYGKD